MTYPPTIQTPRLLLRPIRPAEDTPDFFEWYRIESVRKYTTRPTPTEHHQVTTYLDIRAGPGNFNFSVVLPSEPGHHGDGKVIGLLGSRGFPEIGYLFDPRYHGQGYASEALRAYLPQMFAHMPSAASTLAAESASANGTSSGSDVDGAFQAFDYALAHVDVENASSIKLLERCGWTRGEVTKNDYTSPQLGVRDAVTYRIARPGMRLEDVVEGFKQVEDHERPVPDLQ